MSQQPSPTPKQQIFVMWILWASFLVGIFFFQAFLVPSGRNSLPPGDAFPWPIALVPFAVSAVVRWVVLPRVRHPQQGLVCMILGIAFAEATCFFGIFLVPSHQKALFFLSLLGVFQFIPVYARRFFRSGGDDSP